MATIVYQYPKCSTCREALKWLDERGVSYEKRDLVANPPSLAEGGRTPAAARDGEERRR